MKQFKLYVDMDGVLTSFIGGYKKLTGMHFDHYRYIYGDEATWKRISDYGEDRFWRNLEWTEWGQDLWYTLKRYNPVILTATGRDVEGNVARAKVEWCHYHLDKNIEVHCTAEKYKYANKDAYLLDDCYQQREEFYHNDGNVITVYSRETAIQAVSIINNVASIPDPKTDTRRVYA
jgi:hypothetical protein